MQTITDKSLGTSISRPTLRLDRGLEEIFAYGEEAVLPASSLLRPIQMTFSGQISEMLEPLGIDDYLRHELLPEPAETELLTPAAFKAELEAVLRRLRDSRAIPTVRRALDLIERDLALLELLSYYRNALLQG